jgi:predicted DNA-binding antitoxin AbrB/MazE fold protein
MPRVTEAIFSGGVLKPLTDLGLKESERVRIIVQPIARPNSGGRIAAMERLRRGIATMRFRSTGPLPTRDQLHDRS